MQGNATWSRAAMLTILLALPAGAWAQATASWTATGARQDCPAAACLLVFFDSNQAPGEPITLNGSASSSPPDSAAIVSWNWTIDGQAMSSGTSPLLPLTLGDGSHQVTLVVVDSQGIPSSPNTQTVTIAAPNQAVIAGGNRTLVNTNGPPGQPVTLDGSQSTNGDAQFCGCSITSYVWTVNGQGTTQNVATPTFVLPVGANTITLVVASQNQTSAAAQVTITVTQPAPLTPPTAVIAGGNRTIPNTSGQPGAAVVVDGSGSTAPAPATIIAYQWSVNGTLVPAATGSKPTLNLNAGTNTVSLTVIDSQEVASAPASVTLTVLGPIAVQITGGSRTVPDTDGLPGEAVPLVGTATSAGRTIPPSAFAWVATAVVAGQTVTVATTQGTDRPTLRLRDGANTVTLSVTDPTGGFVTSAVVTITVAGANAGAVPNPISSIPGLTANQKAVAQAIEQSCADLSTQYVNGTALAGSQTDLLQQCRALIRDHVNAVDIAGLQRALDALSGQQITEMQRMGLVFSDSQFKNLGDRLTELRRGQRGMSLAGLHVQAGNGALPLELLAGVASKALGGGAGDQNPDSELLKDRLGVFVDGDLRIGDRTATDRESAFDLRNHSYTLGIDYRFGGEFVAGAAFGYGRATSRFSGPDARLDSRNMTGSLYGSWYVNDWYLDWIGSYGKLDYDSSRHVLFNSTVVTSSNGIVDRIATGTTNGRQAAVSANTGYDFHAGGWLFGPTISLNYVKVNIDGFAESGASGLNLAFDQQRGDSFTVKAGAHLSYAWTTAVGVILPHLQGAAVHEFANAAQSVNARFAADALASFAILTDAPDRDYFRWSAGVSAQFPFGIAAFVDYQALAGLAHTSQHDITLGLRIATRF
jgi:outer membrane lipase/esterase